MAQQIGIHTGGISASLFSSVTLNDRGKQEAKIRRDLRKKKKSLSEQEVQGLVEKTQILQELQVAPDLPEALATLPSLQLEDVGKKVPVFPCEIRKQKSPKILFHDLFTNKIAYTQMCFNTDRVPQDMVQYLPLLGRLVLGMGTNKRD